MRLGRPNGADAVALALIAVAAVAFAFQVWTLFGRLPVPWPDESLFAEPALRLLRDGRLASPLVSGAAAGVVERTYWYPFGYFLVLSGAFAAFGGTLAVMRAVSVVAALALLAITFGLGRRVGLSRPLAAGALALLALDPVFVRSAIVGRPDVLALALIAASVLLGPGGDRLRRFGCGACAGCATVVHPFGAIALLILVARLERSRRALPAIAGAAIPLAAWMTYVLQDLPSFIDQIGLNFALHERPWSILGVVANVLNQYPDPWALAILPAWLTGSIGLVAASRNDRRAAPVLAAFALTSALTLSLQMWHPLYALPFMYLGIAIVLAAGLRAFCAGRPAVGRALATAATVAVVASIIALDVDQLVTHAAIATTVRRDAYADWTTAIADAVPAGSRLLIGGLPDPAWGLFGRDLRLVALQDDARSYGHYAAQLGDEVDYVVLTGSVPRRWLDLVQQGATVERRILIDTGQHDTRCEDWVPCGPLAATIYRVRH